MTHSIWVPPPCNHQFDVKFNGASTTSGKCSVCGHPVVIVPACKTYKNGETINLKGQLC